MKKGLWLSLVGVILVTLALSAGVLAEGNVVTLTHYKFNSRQNQVDLLKELASEFEALHPNIKINIVTGPEGPSYEEKVKVMLAGGNPPDITEFYTVLASSLAEAGQFEDLRPYIARDSRWKDMQIIPAAVAGSTWSDGTMFTMPAVIGGNILAYNGTLVEDAGYNHPSEMGDAWNWDTMMSLVKKISRDENNDGTNEKWGNMGRVGLSRILTYMSQAGGTPFNAVYSPTAADFTAPGVEQGARFAAELLNPKVGTMNYNQFIKGNVGFIWIGIFPFSVELARMRDEENLVDYRVAPWPKGPANNRNTVTEVRGWQIMKDSKHKEEAWEWISFVHLNEDRALRFADVHGWIPASRKLQGPWISSLGFSGVENQMVSIALQSTLEEGNIPTPAGAGVLDVMKVWDTKFRDVVSEKTPLKYFLEDMNHEAVEYLNQK